MVQPVDLYFDATARQYDERTLRAHPCYREMLAQVVAALPERATDIIELGCGTGALTELVAGRYPDARIRAVDAAPRMIEVAKERLGPAAGRIEFDVAAFEKLQLPAHAFDLITANMSLHHVAAKGPLYALLHRALRPNGVLVFGDELCGATPEIEERHLEGWKAYARQPGHLTPAEFEEINQHIEQFDHYETLPRQLDLLAEAGFAPVDCTWRLLNYAVFVAVP
jgi:ubiquinone/menaquinone biosynthesis C-methylase UbiE